MPSKTRPRSEHSLREWAVTLYVEGVLRVELPRMAAQRNKTRNIKVG